MELSVFWDSEKIIIKLQKTLDKVNFVVYNTDNEQMFGR